jgi:4-amino-4-deoxy-L-arabinose transferase-like glycosyltransferase
MPPFRISLPSGRLAALPDALLFGLSSLAAFVLRLVYLLPLRGQALFDEPHRDSIEYVDRARGILAGDFWGSGVYFHSAPLYPYFLALIMGPTGATGLWWVRVAQALLSGLTAGLLALIGRRLFGRAAGVATAVLAVLYAPFLFYSGELLEITLTLFFLALLAWILAREQLAGRHLVAGGLCLGLAALGKPNLLILAPVILVAIGFLRPLRRPATWPWRRGLLFVAGILVVVAPFTLRNKLVGDDWVLISSNGGINLFIGNNPTANGGFTVPTAMQYDLEASSRRVASEALGREAKPSEASRFWASRAWVFMSGRPGEALQLLVRKAGLLIGSYEIPNHFNIYFFRENFAPVLRWPLVWYTLALPFGVLGLAAGLRRDRRTRLAAACLLAIAATVLLFFVTSRYRLPMLVWLLPFAGYGLVLLVTVLRERRWRLVAFFLALLLVTGALMHLPLVKGKDFHDDWETLAFYWGRQGDWDRAAFYNQQALRENMRSAAAWQNLGYAYTQRGRDLADWDRAEECFYKAIELDPTFAHAYGNLAFVYYTWDRPELFASCLDRALALDPALKETLAELVRYRAPKLLGWRERAEHQLGAVREQRAQAPADPWLMMEEGRILGIRLEDYAGSLRVLGAIPAAALAADSGLADRVTVLRQRVERAQRYAPLLSRPLPGGKRPPMGPLGAPTR